MATACVADRSLDFAMGIDLCFQTLDVVLMQHLLSGNRLQSGDWAAANLESHSSSQHWTFGSHVDM